MPGARWQIDRLVDDVTLLGRRGLPREQYYSELAARLRRVIDCDATCWHTLDPQTRLMTSDAPHELISEGVFSPQTAPGAGALLLRSEYFVKDVNTFAALAARRVPVGILSQATKGRPERSPRYRDLLAPAGIPFELRVAFLTRGRCWGARLTLRGVSISEISALRTRPRSRASRARSPKASAPPFASMRRAWHRTARPPGSSFSVPRTRSS